MTKTNNFLFLHKSPHFSAIYLVFFLLRRSFSRFNLSFFPSNFVKLEHVRRRHFYLSPPVFPVSLFLPCQGLIEILSGRSKNLGAEIGQSKSMLLSVSFTEIEDRDNMTQINLYSFTKFLLSAKRGTGQCTSKLSMTRARKF